MMRFRTTRYSARLLVALAGMVLFIGAIGFESSIGVSAGWAKPAKQLPKAVGARLAGDAKRTRFIVDLTRAVGFNVFVLADPFRVIMDLPEVNFQLAPRLGQSGRGLVSAYRYGRFAQGKSRIVLDITAPVLIEKSFSLKSANGRPARLVIDLVSTDRKTFMQKQSVIRPRSAPNREKALAVDVPRPRSKPVLQQKARLNLRPDARIRRPEKPTVMIDPGHGGVDPGAIGRNGTTEKEVVFEFAKILRKALKKTGKYNVLMTRERDTFMRLQERTNKARKHGADLFIAVHADSLEKGEARGATVYTLSETASDREAAALAAKENRADIIAGVDLGEQSDEVTGILIDLAQRETNNAALGFAKKLVGKLRDATKLASNPHRFAGFRVLKAPDVPSVLLELGYLSSRDDERLLKSRNWRRKTSAAVVDAVDSYFRARLASGGL